MEHAAASRTSVIFLDIDGVVCCNYDTRLEKKKLERVAKLTKATGAKVVLSSDWRRSPNLKRRALEAIAALGGQCAGVTAQRSWMSRVRPLEITDWLDGCGRVVEKWVALDDRALVEEVRGLTG